MARMDDAVDRERGFHRVAVRDVLGAFWVVAVLFGVEHGPLWDVGIVTGVLYNWWMVRTRSLGDLILVHAITNACLSAYVLASGKWEYWP